MAKQSEQNIDRYNDIFPTTLRGLLEKNPKDGRSTTYKALGEAVGVRQQTISQYASGITQPTADVVLQIARFFGVSVDYLLTGVSSYNKEYNEELGLSDAAVELMKRARRLHPQADPKKVQTIPYLDELLSDKDFYQFLEDLHFSVDRLIKKQNGDYEINEELQGLNLEGYFIWELQMFVQDFILKEIKKLGLRIESE